MRAGLMLGLVGLGIVSTACPAEAKGRRGGGVVVAQAHAAAAAPATEPARIRVTAAGAPEPMTTGTTAPVARQEATRQEAAPARAPVPSPARPWCTGRVFGSGAGFCAIN